MFGNTHEDIIPDSTVEIEKFNKMLSKKTLEKPTLVWFYGNFCGHCHSMYDDWKTISNNSAVTKRVNVLKIESEQKDILSKDPDVFGYPTVRLYKITGGFVEYDGNRDAEDMKKFVVKNTKQQKSLKKKKTPKKKPVKKPRKSQKKQK